MDVFKLTGSFHSWVWLTGKSIKNLLYFCHVFLISIFPMILSSSFHLSAMAELYLKAGSSHSQDSVTCESGRRLALYLHTVHIAFCHALSFLQRRLGHWKTMTHQGLWCEVCVYPYLKRWQKEHKSQRILGNAVFWTTAAVNGCLYKACTRSHQWDQAAAFPQH